MRGALTIGDIGHAARVGLAPMAGTTDRPFRELCRSQGAGWCVSEMLTSDTRLWNSRKSRTRLDFQGESGTIIVQLAGHDPATMAEAARRCVDAGAHIIDINMGCPAKKVCRRLAGSALLADEALVGRILRRVAAAVQVPVTLKTRTGCSPDRRNGARIAEIAEDSGIAAIAVHGRTRQCRYRGEAEFDTIREIKTRVQIPVIANGDVDSPKRAAEVLRSTGADGLLIGRAARGKPWLFRQINAYLETGTPSADPKPEAVRVIIARHLASMHEFYGERAGVRLARKHIGWYLQYLPGNVKLKKKLMQAESAREQLDLLHQYCCDMNTGYENDSPPPLAAA